MPTYGYHCPSCAQDFDVWQRMTDPPQAACPACGGAARRLFFPAGIVFKGSGFYKTDSRTASGASGGGSTAAAKPGADGARGEGARTDTTSPAGSGSGTSTGKAAPGSSAAPAHKPTSSGGGDSSG